MFEDIIFIVRLSRKNLQIELLISDSARLKNIGVF